MKTACCPQFRVWKHSSSIPSPFLNGHHNQQRKIRTCWLEEPKIWLRLPLDFPRFEWKEDRRMNVKVVTLYPVFLLSHGGIDDEWKNISPPIVVATSIIHQRHDARLDDWIGDLQTPVTTTQKDRIWLLPVGEESQEIVAENDSENRWLGWYLFYVKKVIEKLSAKPRERMCFKESTKKKVITVQHFWIKLRIEYFCCNISIASTGRTLPYQKKP